MRKSILTVSTLLLAITAFSQLTTVPDGGNKKAFVGERIGITDVTIHYDRPGVKKREGEIWGKLVHTGFIKQDFGNQKEAPWRAGANENTTIEFSTPVSIEGKPLPAGRYGLFIAYGPDECTVVFNKNSTSWGSYYYEAGEDALRVKVKPVAIDKSVEWLKYEFIDQTNTSATVALEWEKLMVPFRIDVDYIPLQLESFRRELRGEKSFNPGWQSWNQAAIFCLQNDVNLEEGLSWAETSVNNRFFGDKNFESMSTLADLMKKLNRNREGDSVMQAALPFGNEVQVHTYARQLVKMKKAKEAFDIFKYNYDRHPNSYTTNMGMTRGYSALGNYKKALEFANKAYAINPGGQEKQNVEKVIKMLQEGKDVN